MIFYVVILATLSILLISSWLLESNIPVIIMGIIMIVTAGLRYNTGFDYNSYHMVYSEIANGTTLSSITPHFESGFMMLNWCAIQLGISFNLFLLFFSGLTLGLLTLFLVKLNDPELASMALYYYFVRFFFTRDMGQIRSSFAAVVCLFAIRSMIREKRYRAILLVLLASFFQKVALILLVTFVLVYLIKKHLNILTFLIVTILTGITSKVISGLLTSHAELLGDYSTYTTADSFISGSGLLNPVIWMQFFIGLIAIIVFYQITSGVNRRQFLTDAVDQSLESIQYVVAIYIVGTLILILLNQLPTAAGRTSTALNTVEILIIPLIIRRCVSRMLQLPVFMFLAVVVWYVFFMRMELLNFIPYTSSLGVFD
ncbi:EpsG family protein [Lactiplantibacillus plantarum]|uniref:EpsG family protein n=1 Tax=Lactiplantibacillus plantarum TaxID=1590 RepID=UPI002017EAB6|nr:EpsG family protein [Lactiplantibacillus plantarum]UQN23972.1 EpsG family protein [Lactiplantibacillus plantarum]